MFESILILCTGNICRSPIAEKLMQKLLPTKNITSAGVGALVGHPADDSAIYIAQELGLSLEGHKGRQFDAELARHYDLILVMDKGNLERVSRLAPEARGKTMLLGHWLGEKEIPDPYRKSLEAFKSVSQLIDQACKSWAIKLKD